MSLTFKIVSNFFFFWSVSHAPECTSYWDSFMFKIFQVQKICLVKIFSVLYIYNFILNSRWFCHFDDDNYVNVPRLLEILSNYNPQKDWYLGKPSIRTPLEISKIKVNLPPFLINMLTGCPICLSTQRLCCTCQL